MNAAPEPVPDPRPTGDPRCFSQFGLTITPAAANHGHQRDQPPVRGGGARAAINPA